MQDLCKPSAESSLYAEVQPRLAMYSKYIAKIIKISENNELKSNYFGISGDKWL